MEEYNPDIITLSDDTGKEYTFEVLDGVETDDGKYLAVTPVYDDPEEAVQDSGDLVILKATEEDGEYYYDEIEDDEEYETIADIFVERLSEVFDIDEE